MNEQPAKEMKAGWGRPLAARKWHYFPVGEIQSPCKKWSCGDLVERGPRHSQHPDNCAACKRWLETSRSQQAEARP